MKSESLVFLDKNLIFTKFHKYFIFHRQRFTFDENHDQLSSRENSSEPSTTSPRILQRKANLIKRSSIDIENEEQVTWHNLPKDIFRKSAEVNNKK